MFKNYKKDKNDKMLLSDNVDEKVIKKTPNKMDDVMDSLMNKKKNRG